MQEVLCSLRPVLCLLILRFVFSLGAVRFLQNGINVMAALLHMGEWT
jgi:hypothetical protein